MDVSRETDAWLRQYQALLLRWQEKINLISPATVKNAWVRHFEDSLQLLPLIPAQAKTLYDLGSGAGFPGLVLALARPDLAVTLVESDAKKCAFLQAVSRETGTAVTIRNQRIDAAVADLPPPDVITARALAGLGELFKYVRLWSKAEQTLIFPKGENWRSEITAARKAGWDFDVADYPSRTEKEARILVFTNLRKAGV